MTTGMSASRLSSATTPRACRRCDDRTPGHPSAAKRRKHPRQLGRQRGHSPAPAIDQLHARGGQLFVPGRQPTLGAGPLEQPIAPRQDLAIAQQRWKVAGVQPRSEAIDEAAPGCGWAVQDRQILPAEDDDPGPRTQIPRALPGAVFDTLDRPADGAAAFGVDQVTAECRRLRPPRRQVGQPRGPERPSRQEHTKAFEEVRLALRVTSRKDVQPVRRSIGKGLKIAKITQNQAANLHPSRVPFPVENSVPNSS